MNRPHPRQPAPRFSVDTIAHGRWSLAERSAGRHKLIVVYRGLHCGICANYVGRLAALAPAFAAHGIDILAASTDPREKAAQAVEEWRLGDLAVGHDLPLSIAGDWGLYVSSARKEGEPARFFEPGLFVIAPDSTLFFASTQNMPFGRPDLTEVLGWIVKAKAEGVPARGELALAPA